MTIAGANSPRVKQCVSIIRAEPGISRARIAAKMGCKPNTVENYLRAARKAAMIQPTGVGRLITWDVCGIDDSRPWPRVSSVWQLGAAL